MQLVAYYLSLPFIYVVSLLPFPVLYFLSDVIYLFLYKVIRYRRKVVRINLSNAFPEKMDSELLHLESKVYRYFCDLLLESIKNLTIDEHELRKRLKFESLALFKKYHQQNQSIVVMMGHFGNWELAGSRIALEKFHKTFVVYKPQKNQYVDDLVKKMRTRFGNGVYPMKGVTRGMLKNKEKLTSTVFLSDQNPMIPNPAELSFLNQRTHVFDGAERLAKKFEYPVVYASVRRVKRGYYSVLLEEICHQKEVVTTDVTSAFFKKLQCSIEANPETWLWTHKRWKRTNNGAYNS